MAHKQLSDQQRQWLARESADWREQEIITQEQQDRITAGYESEADSGERKRSRASFAIMGIAAFLVGLSVLLLIGYNWDALSHAVKLALIFGVVIGTHLCGFCLYWKWKSPRLAEVVFFLGCLFYGAGIWLIAQVFHLDAHYPDGLWWWALGVLPFALVLESSLLHFLFAALLGIWAGMELLSFAHLGWWMGWWMLPNGAYSLPFLAVIGLLWAYRKGSARVVAIYTALSAWWVVLQAFAWNCEWQAIFIAGTVGAIFLMLAESHRKNSRMAIPYRTYGILLAAGALVPLSFAGFYKEILYSRSYYTYYQMQHADFSVLIAIVALIAATIAGIFLFRHRPEGQAHVPFAGLSEYLRAQWVPAGLSLCMAFIAFWVSSMELWQGGNATKTLEARWVPAVLANVAMIVLAIWMMQTGLREDRGRSFALGVVYFLLWSVLRYADLFGEAGGMLGASLMFFLCGALLFGLAMFWRRRKEAIRV